MFLLRLYTILYCIPDELFIRSSHHRKKGKGWLRSLKYFLGFNTTVCVSNTLIIDYGDLVYAVGLL